MRPTTSSLTLIGLLIAAPHVQAAASHSFICAGQAVVRRVSPEGKIVWGLSANDLPGNPLRFVAGVQRLPNGNTIVCNWGGHGHVRKQPQIFEVTRDKRVVWQFDDKASKQFRTIASAQLLDVDGEPLR